MPAWKGGGIREGADKMGFAVYKSLEEHSVGDLESRLDRLTRWYGRRRSPWLALAIASVLESLCRHPDYGDAPDRCACRRSVRRWRFLAGGTG